MSPVAAACAAESQGFTADFLTFVTRAQEEVRKTGLMLHRRALFMELAILERMCRGRPQFGPGVLGQLGALMAGEPFPMGVEAGLGVPVDDALIARLIGHLMELDQVHLVNSLISSRAEQAFPGLLKQVTSSLRIRGASVHDDGEMSLLCVVGDESAGSESARLLGRHPDMHAIDGRKFQELLEELRNQLVEHVDTVRGLDETVERVSGRELDDAAKGALEDWFAKHAGGPKESSKVCFVPEGAKYWATIRRLLPMAKLIEVSCISGAGDPEKAAVAPTTKVSDRTLFLGVHSLERQLQSCLTMALAFADEAWFSLEKLS